MQQDNRPVAEACQLVTDCLHVNSWHTVFLHIIMSHTHTVAYWGGTTCNTLSPLSTKKCSILLLPETSTGRLQFHSHPFIKFQICHWERDWIVSNKGKRR